MGLPLLSHHELVLLVLDNQGHGAVRAAAGELQPELPRASVQLINRALKADRVLADPFVQLDLLPDDHLGRIYTGL